MLKISKLFFCIWMLLVSVIVNAQTSTTKSIDSPPENIRQMIDIFLMQNHIPGVAVAYYVNGKPYAYYAGYADVEKKIPVTEDTIFEVGSISKIMTSLLFAQEVDMANMSFSDPVKKYLPDLPPNLDKVTLLELATHTSGLALNVPAAIQTPTQLNQYLAKLPLPYAPGEEWIYSNIGIGLLANALTNATQRDYNDLYRKHITIPLGMRSIGFSVPERWRSLVAQGYDANNQAVPAADDGLFPTAYGIKMSGKDMRQFLIAAIGLPGTPERVFYPMRMTQVAYFQVGDRSQGLAWVLHPKAFANQARLIRNAGKIDMGPERAYLIPDQPVFSGDALIDKTGMTKGFRAYIAVIPNTQSGIAILANKNIPNAAIVKTAREILFKVINQPT